MICLQERFYLKNYIYWLYRTTWPQENRYQRRVQNTCGGPPDYSMAWSATIKEGEELHAKTDLSYNTWNWSNLCPNSWHQRGSRFFEGLDLWLWLTCHGPSTIWEAVIISLCMLLERDSLCLTFFSTFPGKKKEIDLTMPKCARKLRQI